MNFAQVLEALRQGKMVSRQSFNPGDFIFMQVPSDIPAAIVPNMQSLPQAVKDEFLRRFNDPPLQTDALHYKHQLAFVDADNQIRGWSPQPTDLLVSDWMIIE